MDYQEDNLYPAVMLPSNGFTSDTLALFNQGLVAWDGIKDVTIANEDLESRRLGVEVSRFGVFVGGTHTVTRKQTIRLTLPKNYLFGNETFDC